MTNDPAAGRATPAPDAADAFAERIFGAVLGAQLIQTIDLGDRLGWYRSLAADGPATSVELADRTGSAERYAREWLEHQAACGVLTVDDEAAAPTERRFTLPPAHAAVLADPDSTAFMTPIARFATASGLFIDRIADTYRTGAGLSWDDLGDEAREAQAGANRPLFLHRLVQDLLAGGARRARPAAAGGADRRRRLRLRVVVDRARPRLRGRSRRRLRHRRAVGRGGRPQRGRGRGGRPAHVPRRRRRRPRRRAGGCLRRGVRVRVHPRHARSSVGAGRHAADGRRRRRGRGHGRARRGPVLRAGARGRATACTATR